ncbi:hypothetical protein QTP88_026249 [Uroleucon formosanum]
MKNELQKFSLGAWNVRTMYAAGAMTTILSALQRYLCEIVAMQEIRWTNVGNIKLRDATILYSCGQSYEYGVGFIVNNSILPFVKNFIPHSERIFTIQLECKWGDIAVINSHAPTENKEDQSKEEFYNQLERVYNSIPHSIRKIIIGDLNAKIGKEQIFKPTIGEHSLHEISNDNGSILISFAMSKNMTISSSRFPHKEIHKQTWISPDEHTKNQIDYVVVDEQLKHSIQDFDIDKVKEKQTANEYRKGLKDKGNNNLKLNYQEHWTQLSKTIKEVIEEKIGIVNNKKIKQWFKENCKKTIQERDKAKSLVIMKSSIENKRRLAQKQREMKKVIRREKRELEKQRIEMMEESYKDSKTFFRKANEIRKPYKPKYLIIKNEYNELITDEQVISEEFKKFFQEMLNPPKIEDQGQDNDVFTTVEQYQCIPGKEEIKEAIEILKNNKVPGENMIAAELIKKGGELIFNDMWELIKKI